MFVILVSFNSSFSQNENSPRRIISLAPHITEIVFKLGAGEYLIARTDFCKYPSNAHGLPSVGGYLNVDYEKLIRLKPDLILQFPNRDNRVRLEKLGYMVEELPNETIKQILDSIRKAGSILNRELKAKQICQGIKDTLRMFRTVGNKITHAPNAMIVVGRERGSLRGLQLAGGRTYLSEVWSNCGGKNVYSDISIRYFSAGLEDIIKRNIDVILEFHPGWDLSGEDRLMELKTWDLLVSLNAVKQSEIYIFSDDYFVIPGPRITRIARKFSNIIMQVTEKSR